MFSFKRKIFTALLGALLPVMLCGTGAKAASYPDTQTNWASPAIEALTAKGVLNGYPDGTFKPDQLISRAELAKIVTKTFNYRTDSSSQLPDIEHSWANAYIQPLLTRKLFGLYPDDNFRPNDPVSRVKIASILSGVLHLGTPEENFNKALTADYHDLSTKYWGYKYIAIGAKLGVFPASFTTDFRPDQSLTRAEAVAIIKNLADLVVTKGKITQVNPDTGLVTVQAANGHNPLLAMITAHTILMRNNITNSLDSLLTGDDATVIALPSGEVKFFKAFGQVTKNDLLSRASSLTRGTLTPEQINAIASGDWNAVKDGFKEGLYNRLIGLGLTPAEAESLMVRDWNYLDTLSRDRLSKALSNQFGISQDFSQALLARDLSRIKQYGKIELATAALTRLLGKTATGNV